MRKLWGFTTFMTLFCALIVVWIFVIGISSGKHGSSFNKGHNAVWIGHKWVGEAQSDSEIRELVETLRAHQIDTVFVHSGPIESDGNIDPETYKYSVAFLEKAKQLDPNIHYQAWLGQIRGKLDLGDEGVRHNTAKLCMIMGNLVGFDGIHFDIEPVWDDDKDFIKLLDECRELLPEDKKLSVALAEFIPHSLIWFLENLYEFDNYNTEINYESVAQHADQIVVMAYDTGFKISELYSFLVSEQTIRVTSLYDDKEVFIGIPTYEEVKEGFYPEVENIRTGLEGITKGMNNFRSNKENFAGVALYSFWEIDEEEWKTYDNLWLKSLEND